MNELLLNWWGPASAVAHTDCETWSPQLLWSMAGTNIAMAAAYIAIPVGLMHFARRRGEPQLRWPMLLFAAFILAGAATHLVAVWSLWQHDHVIELLAKVFTAVLSVACACALWMLIPAALKIPSVRQLQGVIDSLEGEARARRSAEEHLIDLRESLTVTLASIGAGLISTDRAGNVVHMNMVAETVTGWNPTDARGRSLWEVFAREGRPVEYEQTNPVDLVIQRNITPEQVALFVCVSRSGQRATVEARAALTHAPDGNVRGLALLFRDVTRIQQAEAESRQLAAIVESSYDAIIAKTLEGRVTSWNQAAQDLFGHTAQDMLGQSIETLIPPDRLDEEQRILARLREGERVPAFDTLRRKKDGSLVEVSVSISPIRDAAGVVVGASKIARDISAQRRIERALRDSEARLRFTLEAAQIGDWELDLASRSISRSLRHDQCFGYCTPQVDWTIGVLLRHVHPDDRWAMASSFQAAVESREDWFFECRVVWPDGSLHWLRGLGRLRQESGESRRMLGIVTDITQQRQAEDARLLAQTLAAENRQVIESNRLKSEFLANMSHELRTPMNSIIGFADLLHSGRVAPDSPEYRLFVSHIRSSGRHLLQLINDILDLSKVEAGKFEFFPQAIDAGLLSTEVAHAMSEQAAAKSIELRVEADPALGEVTVDPQRLRQVLFNYLSNAIKFTPEGGRVILRTLPEGPGRWRIEVEDNGIGIRPEQMPQLFTRFQQLDGGLNKAYAGTGLGLALTGRLVEAQGGRVGATSTHGQGSVFYAVLPRHAVAASDLHDGPPADQSLAA